MINIFLSYCQKDSSYADIIEQHYLNSDVKIHRDIRDISAWQSIRKFMDTIRDNDFAVLIITDNYLKSYNCMYEVLQVMKEKDYEDRIFPIVINHNIYSEDEKIKYIKYWEEKCNDLEYKLSEIKYSNSKSLIDKLCTAQDIAASIGDFLDIVSIMNNPAFQDAITAIDTILEQKSVTSIAQSNDNYFEKLNIDKPIISKQITDLDKNNFVKKSYETVIKNLNGLSEQFNSQNNCYYIAVEEVSKNEAVIQIFNEGNFISGLRIFINYIYGGAVLSILISQDINIGSKNSYNEMYMPEAEAGNLLFKGQITHILGNGNSNLMNSEELTKEIWEYFIHPCLQ